MKLERREKILAAAVGAVLALVAAWFLLFPGGDSYDQLKAEKTKLEQDVKQKEDSVAAAAVAAKRLADWDRRALPSDVTEGRTEYTRWLRELMTQFDFQQPTIDSSIGSSKAKTFTSLKFKVHGRMQLSKLAEFLYKFYAAGHLHKIDRLDVSAVPNSTSLEVTIDIEALSLPGADRPKALTTVAGKALGQKKPADYAKPIDDRNLFAAYHPRERTPNRRTMTPDRWKATESMFVTGVLDVGGRREVWLLNTQTNKPSILHEGEKIEVGSLPCRIKTIGARDVVIDIDGRLRRYDCGSGGPCCLHDGVEVRE